jgi:6-phosphogluconolactonase
LIRHIYSDELFSVSVANALAESFVRIVNEQGRATVALTGGSTPRPVYQMLANHPLVTKDVWQKLIFFLGDERLVSLESPQSNYRMVKESLIEPLRARDIQISCLTIDISSRELLRDYELSVVSELNQGRLNQGVIDLLLLGMGEDGHVASLFPESLLLQEDGLQEHSSLEKGTFFGIASHPSDGTKRVSLLAKPLIEAREVHFLVSGAKKAEMVYRVFHTDSVPLNLPARIATIMKGVVQWHLDQSAAGYDKII